MIAAQTLRFARYYALGYMHGYNDGDHVEWQEMMKKCTDRDDAYAIRLGFYAGCDDYYTSTDPERQSLDNRK